MLKDKGEYGTGMVQLAVIREKLSDKAVPVWAFAAEDFGRKLLTEARPSARHREE
jgi:hypothetical protein